MGRPDMKPSSARATIGWRHSPHSPSRTTATPFRPLASANRSAPTAAAGFWLAAPGFVRRVPVCLPGTNSRFCRASRYSSKIPTTAPLAGNVPMGGSLDQPIPTVRLERPRAERPRHGFIKAALRCIPCTAHPLLVQDPPGETRCGSASCPPLILLTSPPGCTSWIAASGIEVAWMSETCRGGARLSFACWTASLTAHKDKRRLQQMHIPAGCCGSEAFEPGTPNRTYWWRRTLRLRSRRRMPLASVKACCRLNRL